MIDGHFSQFGSLLLYLDEAVLLSHSQKALKYLLLVFVSYCETKLLSVNFEKSKILCAGGDS